MIGSPVISVDDDRVNFSLIIKDEEARVSYTNQVGGCACYHPRERGYLVNLFIDLDLDEFQKYFMSGKYGGCCDDADWLDAQLEGKGFKTSDSEQRLTLKVDRSMLTQSFEAWIHVILSNGNRGVLTWQNSD